MASSNTNDAASATAFHTLGDSRDASHPPSEPEYEQDLEIAMKASLETLASEAAFGGNNNDSLYKRIASTRKMSVEDKRSLIKDVITKPGLEDFAGTQNIQKAKTLLDTMNAELKKPRGPSWNGKLCATYMLAIK